MIYLISLFWLHFLMEDAMTCWKMMHFNSNRKMKGKMQEGNLIRIKKITAKQVSNFNFKKHGMPEIIGKIYI